MARSTGPLSLAESYQGRHSSPRRDANALIRWQTAKAAGLGFITGVPGLPAMPVTLPANLTSVLFIQIRMIAGYSLLGGLRPQRRSRKNAVLCLSLWECS